MSGRMKPLPSVVLDLSVIEDEAEVRLGVVVRADEAATRAAFASLSARASSRPPSPRGVVGLRSEERGVEGRLVVPWLVLVEEVGRARSRWVDEVVFRRVSSACRREPRFTVASAAFLLDDDGPLAVLSELLEGWGDDTVARTHLVPLVALLRLHVEAGAVGRPMSEVERRRLRFLLGDLLSEPRRSALSWSERVAVDLVARVHHARPGEAALLAGALAGRGSEGVLRLRCALDRHGVEDRAVAVRGLSRIEAA